MVQIKRVINSIRKLSKRKKILYGLTIILLLFVTVFLYISFSSSTEDNAHNPGSYDIITYSTEKPSEKAVKNYTVPPDMPWKINLKSIQRDGYIQPVGIDQHGDIAVPSNVLMAGWYINSVKPGDAGLSIVTGHRDGRIRPGIFRHIGNLKKGDAFEITYGDGSIRKFEVVDVRIKSIEDTYELMYEKREDIERQLNLIGCTGTYDKDAATYDKRITIISEGTM